MPTIKKKQPSFQGVAAGQTAHANLPVGLTYKLLAIRYKRGGTDATVAQIKSDIDEIRLLIDGDVKIQMSGEELLALWEFYGITETDGIIPLVFARPWARSAGGEDVLSYGTADVATMTIEVDIDGAATSPSLEVRSEQSAPTPLGQHVTIRRYSENASGSGVLEKADLPRGAYGLLAIHCTTDAIADIEVEIDNQVISDTDLVFRKFVDGLTGKTHQTGFTHTHFASNDRIADALSLNVQDFRLRLDMTGAANFNIFLERIDTHRPGA